MKKEKKSKLPPAEDGFATKDADYAAGAAEEPEQKEDSSAEKSKKDTKRTKIATVAAAMLALCVLIPVIAFFSGRTGTSSGGQITDATPNAPDHNESDLGPAEPNHGGTDNTESNGDEEDPSIDIELPILPLPDEEAEYGCIYRLNADCESYSFARLEDVSDPSVVIPDTFNGLPVTAISDSAFEGCTDVMSVTIPDSVKSIGNYAFRNCNRLTSVTIPDSVTSIGNWAFNGCTSLTSITIPDSVTSIGDRAFYGCSGLTDVYITDISAWCNINFGNSSSNPLYCADNLYLNGELITELVIPEGVTSIPNYAFYGWKGLTSVTIPDSITSIGYSAFFGCSGITDITVPDSVISIELGAFGGCTALESITLPFVGDAARAASDSYHTTFGYVFGGTSYPGGIATVQYSSAGTIYSIYYIPQTLKSVTVTGGEILYDAFGDCTALESITLPDSVTSIGEWAFRDCDSLTSITIPDNVTAIGERAFWGCDSLTSITIPDNVTAIGEWAFRDCDSLKSVTIPDGVVSIGEYAFYNCFSLTSVTIPDSVTSLGSFAFYNCYALAEARIGDGLKSIGEGCFYNCRGLVSVTVGAGVADISSSAFYDCLKLVEVINRSALTIIPDNGSNQSYAGLHPVEVHTGESKIVNVEDYLFYTYGGVNYLLGYVGTGTELTLPDGYNGEDYEIYEFAFYRRTDLTSVAIPDSVTAIGEHAFYGCTGLTDITIPNGVERIDKYAFSYCSGITEVVIPDSVTAVGHFAFYNCTGLVKAVIPDSVASLGAQMFSGADSLTVYCEAAEQPTGWASNWNDESRPVVWGYVLVESVGLSYTLSEDGTYYIVSGIGTCADSDIVIPSYYNDLPVGAIADMAFWGNESITSIHISGNVTAVGEGAFAACTSLSEVVIGRGVISIGEVAFSACPALENITVSTNNTAFKSVDGNLYTKDGYTLVQYAVGKTDTEFIVPEGVCNIGSYAFYGCAALVSVNLPATLVGIDECGFRACTSLSEIWMTGTAVNRVGKWAFEDCTSLTRVELSSGTDVIGEGAFEGCSALKHIVIPESVSVIESEAFLDCPNLTVYCEAAEQPAGWNEGWNPDGLTVIFDCYSGSEGLSYLISDDGTYYNVVGIGTCTDAHIVIPPIRNRLPVRGIAESAFRYSTITTLVITDGVKYIGEQAFRGSYGLASVTLGKSVESIGASAFDQCDKLIEVINRSSLTISAATTIEYGSLGYYAKEIHSGESKLVSTDDGYFFLTKDGTSYLVGYVGTETDLILPESYNGESYEVYKYAFYNLYDLRSAVIPATVTTVGDYAFGACYEATVYCEAAEQPAGWSTEWNYAACPVVWGYTAEE